MVKADALLNAEQQNFAKRLQDCDGCHDPNNTPVFKVFINVGRIAFGGVSESMFLICSQCAAKPIQVLLHGKGWCAPGVKAEPGHVPLGGANITEVKPAATEARSNALDACRNCGHQRGFHLHVRCGYHNCSCRYFAEPMQETPIEVVEGIEPEIIDTRGSYGKQSSSRTQSSARTPQTQVEPSGGTKTTRNDGSKRQRRRRVNRR